MGARIDTGFAFGKTLDQAFSKLSEQRAWDYGHAGYTGTFAEMIEAAEKWVARRFYSEPY